MDIFDPHEIKILQLLSNKQETLFRHLQFLAKEILKDGAINSKDIPNLILFIKDLYSFVCNIKEEVDLEIHDIQCMLPKFVKKMVQHFAQDCKEEQEIILENIIDACFNLLFCTTDIIGTKKCFRFCGLL